MDITIAVIAKSTMDAVNDNWTGDNMDIVNELCSSLIFLINTAIFFSTERVVYNNYR